MIGVLGGNGFVGKHLVSGVKDAISVSLRDENWRFKIKDSSVIVNLVGKAHDHHRRSSSDEYNFVNLELTKEIFFSFLSSNAKLFIHVSSIAAVEEFEATDSLVETDFCAPVSWYGKSKQMAETWLLQQELPESKKLVILRPPMIHGPGDKGNLGLFFNFVNKGIPYPLSKFNNNRSFLYIGNFIFYINEIIKQSDTVLSGIYHIADDEPISTNQILEIISNVLGKKVVTANVPKLIIKVLAKIGDFIPLPINSIRLKKMTSSLLVSNIKVKNELNIKELPFNAKKGMILTIRSFSNSI